MDTRLRTRHFERILLIKPSAIGDVIHAIPVLVKLRARYPSARIDWMLTPHLAELLRHHPALSNVLLFERDRYVEEFWAGGSAGGLAGLIAQLRQGHYDLVVDLHGQVRSAFFTLMTGARTRIGFDRPRRRIWTNGRPLPRAAFTHGWTGAREGAWIAYSHRIPLPTLDLHAIDRYLRLSEMLGLDDAPPDQRFHLPPQAAVKIEHILARHGLAQKPLVVLAPGTIWETKHWHPQGFAQVARHFLSTGYAVALAGSADDRPLTHAIGDLCPGLLDLAGQTTLPELAALIGRARLCIANDSGPMHLTVAMDRPVLALFGPTDPLWVGPYRRIRSVLRVDLPCSPCYLRQISKCPHDHACMKQLTATTVIARAEELLSV